MTNKTVDWQWCYENPREAAAEIERLYKREAQFAATLYAVKEVAAEDTPQWILADELARIILSQPDDDADALRRSEQR
jgi:hypothetical protein